MSDEQPTRVIKTAVPERGGEDVTKVLGGAAASRPNAEGPQTHVLSGAGAPQSASGGDVYEMTAGWLVVIGGPGRGASRGVFFGMNSVGRNADQRIPLDFGDESISRDSHAYIVYDEMQNDFYVQHGGKANLVRHNGKPVLAPTELQHGDVLEIGATKLMFVPLCGEAFSWKTDEEK